MYSIELIGPLSLKWSAERGVAAQQPLPTRFRDPFSARLTHSDGRKNWHHNGIINIRGARQHNLKNVDLDVRTGEMTVVTGPSGSGKSSLVFDTLYAEGQRRYVETFSAYARQFLDRMDRPQVDRVDGVPPAIAIDQTNPVRSSRSTVGTMTELNDHLKLLYARAAELFDRKTRAAGAARHAGDDLRRIAGAHRAGRSAPRRHVPG